MPKRSSENWGIKHYLAQSHTHYSFLREACLQRDAELSLPQIRKLLI